MRCTDDLQIYSFQTGRRLYVFQQMHARARGLGNEALSPRLEVAISHDRSTLRHERAWEAQRDTGSARGRAAVLDGQLDRLIGGLHRTVQGKREALPADDPEAALAEAFLQRFFPEGAAGYTALPFEAEAAEVDWLLGELHEDAARSHPIAEVGALGIGAFVRQLVALLPAYTEEVKQDGSDRVPYATLRDARLQGLENLARVVARVLGTYDLPAQSEARAALLAPFDQQNARVAAHLKGRRRIPDADPNTGDDEAPQEPTDKDEKAPVA